MKTVSLQEAKNHLDQLVEEAPLFEPLSCDRSLETKVRREVVLALCRLADSLPVLDPRSPEEILRDLEPELF